jgi:putative addiction module component (TIGR02574 family)
MNTLNYKDLSLSEKVLLVEEIWDSIADEKLKLNSEQKLLLSDRLEVYNKTTKRTTWDTIKKNVRVKKRK